MRPIRMDAVRRLLRHKSRKEITPTTLWRVYYFEEIILVTFHGGI